MSDDDVRLKVRALARSTFPTQRGFDAWWASKWRLLEWRTPDDAIAANDGDAVLEAAHAYIDGDYV